MNNDSQACFHTLVSIQFAKIKIKEKNSYKQNASYNSHNNSFSAYRRGSIIILFFIFDMSDRNPDGSVNSFDKYFPMFFRHSVGCEQTDADSTVLHG